MQHIQRLSRAAHRALITCSMHVACQVVRRDSLATKFDRVGTAFILALYSIGTDEGGEETGAPGETPNDELQKMLSRLLVLPH